MNQSSQDISKANMKDLIALNQIANKKDLIVLNQKANKKDLIVLGSKASYEAAVKTSL